MASQLTTETGLFEPAEGEFCREHLTGVDPNSPGLKWMRDAVCPAHIKGSACGGQPVNGSIGFLNKIARILEG